MNINWWKYQSNLNLSIYLLILKVINRLNFGHGVVIYYLLVINGKNR